MTYESRSTLVWLDTSEHERRSVLEFVSALNEPGTLDELGIGSIRDTIADTLFPGTSTIQTRARYFLFLPWILQTVERGSPRLAEDRAERLQLRLCHALDKAHGPNEGVIGREAGSRLQRWPLSIYWVGLERWGIRRHAGSLASYFESLRRPSAWRSIGRALEEPVEGRRDEAADGVLDGWAVVPNAPPHFPDDASFALTAEEGRFLRERVILTHPESFLAHILKPNNVGDSDAAEYPWDHPAAALASESVRNWLHDARLFSLVHRGGVLLFNLLLARELKNADRIEEFSTALAEWSASMSDSRRDMERWDREAMWSRLRGANPRLHRRTRDFADRWFELAVSQAGKAIGEMPEAKRLIREREHALKATRARLTYSEARDRRQGYPTSARLEFRWTQVQRITADILEALV